VDKTPPKSSPRAAAGKEESRRFGSKSLPVDAGEENGVTDPRPALTDECLAWQDASEPRQRATPAAQGELGTFGSAHLLGLDETPDQLIDVAAPGKLAAA
jgi:hypothetical protein